MAFENMFTHQTNILFFFTCDPEAEPRGILLIKNHILEENNLKM